MKRLLPTTQYYFYAGSNYIDFSMFPDFDPKRLLAVINTTRDQTLIYATGGGPSSHTKGTFSGSTGSYQLYLVFDCSGYGMSDTDILELIYDESVGMEEAKASIDIVSGKAGLDINLLNSSFGGKVGSVMPAPFQDNALSIGVLNGGVLESPAMNVNNELIVDVTQSGNIPVSGSVGVYGSVSIDNFPATQAVTVSNFPATQAVTGSFYPATQPVSAVSLPLPAGAATSSLQTTGNTSLSSIDGKLTTLNAKDFSTSAKQDTGNTSLSSMDGKLTVLNAKDFSTSALQTSGNSTLTSIDSRLTTINNKQPVLGSNVIANSTPVNIASDQIVPIISNDLFITGQSTQTAIVNNILPVTAGANATDAFNYKSATVQVVSTGTGGTYIFECSNDNVNFQTMPVYNQLTVTGTSIISSIAATASQLIYTFPIQARYIRLRIVTAITGGSIQAFTKLSQSPFSSAFYTVSQSNSTNLQATVTGSLTAVTTVSTVTSVTSAALQASNTTDIASAAITTTVTSANVAMTNIISAAFVVSVTAISGTSPTLDCVIQETLNGVDYYDIYHFPRISAVGNYSTPILKLNGIGIRYVRTVAGTTPSITMSLIRISRSSPAGHLRNFIDRSIDPSTLNSATPAFFTEGCEKIQLSATLAFTGSGTATFKLQGSEDKTFWYDLNTNVLSLTSGGTGSTVYSYVMPKFTRAIVSAPGIGLVIVQAAIKGVG